MYVYDRIAQVIKSSQSIVILTGAGISADSGIPTFRGKEGIWVKGSKNYFPEELATFASFKKMADTLWEWYSYRMDICAKSQPNAGHRAIVNLEKYCDQNSKEFLLITQNVDNLHRRAGSLNIIEIHGNIFKMRCSSHSDHSYNIVDNNGSMKCDICNQLMRPHVLWFDEYYDDKLYQVTKATTTATNADLLFVIGTTLQTNIPFQIVNHFVRSGKTIVEINPELVLDQYTDLLLSESSSTALPEIIARLK